MAVIVRDAEIEDIPQLVDLLVEFRLIQRSLGVKTITKSPEMLRGGVVVELGIRYNDPNSKLLVAKRDNNIIGFMFAGLEFCGPSDEYEKCVRVIGDYIKDDSLVKGKVLLAMWKELERWGEENNVGYYYGLIHSGNQSSIKAAKNVGFKHHMVQFLKVVKEESA